MIINREGCTAKRSAWKRSALTVPCLSLAACLRENPWRLHFFASNVSFTLTTMNLLCFPASQKGFLPNTSWKCVFILSFLCVQMTHRVDSWSRTSMFSDLLWWELHNTWKWLKGKGKVKFCRRWSEESDGRRWSMECASVCPKVVPPTILVPMSERVSSSWLEIVNTGWVGIFHLCESYSFYFHKNKVEMSDSKQSWTLNT